MYGEPYNDEDYDVTRDADGEIVEFTYRGPRHSEYIPPTREDFKAIGCMLLLFILLLLFYVMFVMPPVGPTNPW